MFIFGFGVLMAQGGFFRYLNDIDIEKLEYACQSSPEELEELRKDKMGWLLVPIAEMSNDYDDYSQSMINGLMCTESCPCY